MALVTFKEFLKNKGADSQIESASNLIALTGFPIKEFSEWYKEYGICLKLERNRKILQEGIWDAAMSGAGYGAVGGTFAGGPVGTAVGATTGFLAGAAKDLLGTGFDWYNKWRDPKGYYEKGFKKQKQQAALTLQNLKKFSQEMAKAGVAGADDDFMKLIDNLITALQDMGSKSPPSPSPAPPPPPPSSPSSPPAGDETGGGDEEVKGPEDLDKKIETLKADGNFQSLLSDINNFTTRTALAGKTPEEQQALKEKYAKAGLHLGVTDDELARAVLVYADSYKTDYAETLKGLRDALIIRTDDPDYKQLLAYAKSLGYDDGYVLDKFQDLMLSNIIDGEEIDQPQAAAELAAWFKQDAAGEPEASS